MSTGPGAIHGRLWPDGRSMMILTLHVPKSYAHEGRVANEAAAANDERFGEPILWLGNPGGIEVADYTTPG